MAMELLEQIEVYLEQSGVSPSTFGRMAVGDPRLVADLKAGRCPRQRTQDRLLNFLIIAQRRIPVDCCVKQGLDQSSCTAPAEPST
jgi:hypothetical protein